MEEKQVSFYNKLISSKAFLIMLPILGLIFGLIFFFSANRKYPDNAGQGGNIFGIF